MQTKIYQGFFRRCWAALRYVFKMDDLQWDSTLVRPEDVPRLRKMLDKVVEIKVKEVPPEGKIFT